MRVRNHKGRYVSERVLVDRVTELKSAGFTVSYAWRDESKRYGHLSTSQLDGEYLGGYRVRTVSGPSEVYGEPYVSFDGVAAGDDSYGQVSTVVRSNYRSLRRDFPTFPWVDTSYLNTNALGCFVADLDDDMTGLMVGLAEVYAVYDEGDMSDLESDEISESWSEYMRGEVWSELPEITRTVMWDFLTEDTVNDLWWACVSADVFGNYPEHHGVEVAWGDRGERAAEFRPFLAAAYWAKRTGRDTDADAPMWVWVGRLADRQRNRRAIDRLYRAWMADETIMHHDGSWRDYLDRHGWVLTATGARRKGTEEA